MIRALLLAILGALLLGVCPAHASPTKGQYREPLRHGKDRSRLFPGRSYEFRDIFRANERACVIVEGDHDPVMNLTINVFDAAGTLVAADIAGGDFVAAIWYPPRTQEYLITITGDKGVYNDLDIIVK